MKKTTSRAPASPAKNTAAPKTVEEYLARVPEPARSTLNKVRARIKETTIRAAVPTETTEVISYRIPGETRGQTGRSPVLRDYATKVRAGGPSFFRLM